MTANTKADHPGRGKFDRRHPCGNCPFRQDAPLAYWHPTMYQMLADLAKREEDVHAGVFGCHKDRALPPIERGMCVGWLLDQRARDTPSLSLRLALLRGGAAAQSQYREAERSGETWSSIDELVEMNLNRDRELNPERYGEGGGS